MLLIGYIKQQGQEKNDVFTLHDRGSHFLLTKQAHVPIIIYTTKAKRLICDGYPRKFGVG